MSFFVGGAVIGSAVIGGIASDRAADKAASGQKKGMEQSLALTNQARQDVMKLFERSATNSGMGMKAALDYYKTAAPKRYTPYLQGSQQAQQAIGQGAMQANNAILGLPVDMGFVNQPQIFPGTDHMIGAQIPQFEQGSIVQPEPVAEQGPVNTKKSSSTGSKVGGLIDKLESKSIGKKLIKKLF